MAKVFIKKRRARPFWFGHPWVFSGAIDRVKGRAQSGDVVTLHDDSGKRIGYGFYNELSQIRGIGPGFAKALREAGVETFAQIGRWNQDDIERVASLLGTHAKRIHNDRWIEQARALDRDR